MIIDRNTITWRCDVCEQERADAHIDVLTVDISAGLGLRPGGALRNIKYCNDRLECRAGAASISRQEMGTPKYHA